MFRGATKITLDDKGRMVIPNRYREQINELAQGKLVVTVDKDQCLLIYPLPEWEQIERKLMDLIPVAGRHDHPPLVVQGDFCCTAKHDLWGA